MDVDDHEYGWMETFPFHSVRRVCVRTSHLSHRFFFTIRSRFSFIRGHELINRSPVYCVHIIYQLLN